MSGAAPGAPPVPGMAWIPGGELAMGSNAHYPEEAPVHRVRVDGFWIDPCPVTNRQYALFVEQTRYATVAERPLDPADFPGAPPENLVPGSLVFTPTPGPVDLRHLSGFVGLSGACVVFGRRPAPTREANHRRKRGQRQALTHLQDSHHGPPLRKTRIDK